MSKWILAVMLAGSLAGCGGQQSTMTERQVTSRDSPGLRTAPPISNIAAFMGDSITAKWDLTQFDIGSTLNFGVGGETSVQMLARFDAVIDAAPGVVAILAGNNDLQAYGPGASTDSIKAMATMARAAGIRVIICAVIPHANTQGQIFTNGDVVAFNAKLIALAQEEGYLYADYNDAFLNPDGTVNGSLYGLNPDGTVLDGTHPGPAGYAVMWKVIAPLLAEDLN